MAAAAILFFLEIVPFRTTMSFVQPIAVSLPNLVQIGQEVGEIYTVYFFPI